MEFLRELNHHVSENQNTVPMVSAAIRRQLTHDLLS
jgi:hypothetical protein